MNALINYSLRTPSNHLYFAAVGDGASVTLTFVLSPKSPTPYCITHRL